MVKQAFKMIDLICHLASFVEACAFVQNDMVRLRIIETLAASLMAVYSYIHSEHNLIDCHFLWAVFHALINIGQLLFEASQRWGVQVNPGEKKLLAKGGLFDIFTFAEFAGLQKHYAWTKYKSSELLVSFGEPVDKLYLVVEGLINILNKDGEIFASVDVSEIGPQFIGELAFFTQGCASATVAVGSRGLVAIEWQMDKVRKCSQAAGDSAVARAFRQLPSLFSTQIAKRLEREEQSRSGALPMHQRSIMRPTQTMSQDETVKMLKMIQQTRKHSVIQTLSDLKNGMAGALTIHGRRPKETAKIFAAVQSPAANKTCELGLIRPKLVQAVGQTRYPHANHSNSLSAGCEATVSSKQETSSLGASPSLSLFSNSLAGSSKVEFNADWSGSPPVAGQNASTRHRASVTNFIVDLMGNLIGNTPLLEESGPPPGLPPRLKPKLKVQSRSGYIRTSLEKQGENGRLMRTTSDSNLNDSRKISIRMSLHVQQQIEDEEINRKSHHGAQRRGTRHSSIVVPGSLLESSFLRTISPRSRRRSELYFLC